MVRHPFRARPRIESSASRDEGAPTSVYSCKSIDIIAPDAAPPGRGGDADRKHAAKKNGVPNEGAQTGSRRILASV